MSTYWLKFQTKTDATFGRGDGVASLIDAEVQHDRYGLPFLGGRSLKGLLEEECASILFALKHQYTYLFCWNDVPGNDTEKFLYFLKQNCAVAWLEDADIKKSADDKTISISKDDNLAEITINEAEEKVALKISDIITYNLKVETENGKLNIYQNKDRKFNRAARHLFGSPGSTDSDKAILHISDARLPADLRKAVASQVDKEDGVNTLHPEQVLNSLTAIRRQTAINKYGAPKKKSLRAMRVILRKTPFEAELTFNQDPSDMDLPLLAACIKAFRRAGTGRNRGRGELAAGLCNKTGADVTDEYFAVFKDQVME